MSLTALCAVAILFASISTSTGECEVFCLEAEFCRQNNCYQCPKRTYQNKKAHQDISCTPWTINKGQGWTIDQQGTNKSDIVWKCANGFFLFNSTYCKANEPTDDDVLTIVVAVLVPLIVTALISITVYFVLKRKKLLCFSDSSKKITYADQTNRTPDDAAELLHPTDNGTTQNSTINAAQMQTFATSAGLNTFAEYHNNISAQINNKPAQINTASAKIVRPSAQISPISTEAPRSITAQNAMLLKVLLTNIQKIVTNDEFQELFIVHLLPCRNEMHNTDLVSTYLHWAEKNPEHDFASAIRAALENLEYLFPDQSNNSSSVADAMKDLNQAIQKRTRLTFSFRSLCLSLCEDYLGRDVYNLFVHLNISSKNTLDREHNLQQLVRWSYRQPCRKSYTWNALTELKSALLKIKRKDIADTFDNLAEETNKVFLTMFL
ncbi:hypothetical protein Bpfe_011165 [Biomphalaria pfeifferi]|uniref:TNFR-Cys domain-containing protein n=1 Tax=Biomphalaria pfeifferi TaxID=112525 RepID=A0AAD8BRE0_BIOPF|nr:hypothetical protein Bpfe_011165 [Biomphalaria pfeifferi]